MFIKFLLSKSLFKHLFILTLIILYAFFINKISGNYGVLPADSFGHFDTSYLINKNIFPIRDYWMNAGFLINYIQALFFYLFGANWQSYVLHASFFNVLISPFKLSSFVCACIEDTVSTIAYTSGYLDLKASNSSTVFGNSEEVRSLLRPAC